MIGNLSELYSVKLSNSQAYTLTSQLKLIKGSVNKKH